MTTQQRRVIDLSSGTFVPQRVQRQSVPPRVVPQQAPTRQNVIFQGVSNPVMTQTGAGPFDNVRHSQDTTTHPTPSQTSQPTTRKEEPSKSKDDRIVVNGCDVTGCSTIAEAYEKNKLKMKFLVV